MSVNKLVMCPYDVVHKVKESRLQLHITKCRLNHLNEAKFTCPFNATHVYPVQEKDYHLSMCPDKAPLDRLLASSLNANNPYKGRTAVPSYNESPPVISDEVWEIDPVPGAGYKPPALPSTAMFMPPANSKPSERRRMYQNLHQRPDAEEIKPVQPAAPVLKPKQPNEPSMVQSQMQNLGLGKGRGAPTRIAANIYSKENGPGAQVPRESGNSAATISGLSSFGIGRGTFCNPTATSDINDEFPALGCGRGVPRNPRSNYSYADSLTNGGSRD